MKNMTFRRLKKLSEQDCGAGDIYLTSSKSDSLVVETPVSMCEEYNYHTLAYSGGTLPRNYRKGALQKWKPLPQPAEQCRKVITLEKGEEETFGFEIQTYGLHHQDQNTVEMCTFVCKVHENSPAHQAGLRIGDTIASVNDTAVEGFRHKEIVQLVRSAGNCIRLETVYSDSIRKAELEARLQYLKQTLHEKWDEYRSLIMQEQRLVHGIVMNEGALFESLESARALVYGSLGSPSPATLRSLPCTGSVSSSSSISTVDEPLYHTCLYPGHEASRPAQRCSSSAADLLAPPSRCQLTRSASTRSYVRGPPPGDKHSAPLSRKPKQMSFRKRLLKFIPGLNRALEEEESKL